MFQAKALTEWCQTRGTCWRGMVAVIFKHEASGRGCHCVLLVAGWWGKWYIWGCLLCTPTATVVESTTYTLDRTPPTGGKPTTCTHNGPVLSSVVAHLLNVVTKLPPLVGECCKVVNGSCYQTVNSRFMKSNGKVFQPIKSVA